LRRQSVHGINAQHQAIDKGLEATIAYFSLNIGSSSREAIVASIESARAARARLPRRREARPKPSSTDRAKHEDMKQEDVR